MFKDKRGKKSVNFLIINYKKIAYKKNKFLEIDTSNKQSNDLFVQIKSSKFQSLKEVNEMYVIESQIEFYMECQISSQSAEEPLVYWWFKPKNSNNKNITKILKKPSLDLNNNFIANSTKRLRRSNNNKTQVNINDKSKTTFVSKIYIDCPTNQNEGEYFCAAIDKNLNLYHISQVKLNVLGLSLYIIYIF